jgi:hypothetical protein
MSRPEVTDWEAYYRRAFWPAALTRRHTGQVLLRLCRRFAPRPASGLVVAELGGADSCFYNALVRGLRPRQYHAIDSCAPGLERLAARRLPGVETVLHHQDVLAALPGLRADLVFSVGLIEHVALADLPRAVAAHFELAAPGGLVIMSFPSPTWLYRLSRAVAEALGLWRFPDERPLARAQVLPLLEPSGRELASAIIWPIFFTQTIMAVRPRTPDPKEGER